jgi:predicted small secreted protein
MKQLIKRHILILFAGTILGISFAGCKHTAHGAGQDIERAGEKIQEKTQ